MFLLIVNLYFKPTESVAPHVQASGLELLTGSTLCIMKIINVVYTLMNKLHGDHSGAMIINGLKDICPELASMTIEWGFGEILSRDGLDIKTRELAIIASCVTLGNAQTAINSSY